jgi:zinc transport system substrate-binding protein
MQNKIKTLLAYTLLFILVLSLSGCSTRSNSTQGNTEKLKVMTTIYPVYEFTNRVGGDKIDVSMLVAPGVEPHDWEPTAQDIVKVKSAKLFLYHGTSLEPIDKILNKDVIGDVKTVEISKGIQALAKSAEDDEEDAPKGTGDKQHQETKLDPHMWLDPVYAQQEVNNIAEALSTVDPQNREYYKKNAESYNKELMQLDQDYKAGLANVTHKDIITSHTAFAYLSKRYNLQQVGIMGLSPDAEPTPDKMANVVKFSKENHIKYIFFESIVSPKLSETIAKATGAELLVLNPIESLTNDEKSQGKNYISIMRENLANLQKALK